jgi:hypothetical protein
MSADEDEKESESSQQKSSLERIHSAAPPALNPYRIYCVMLRLRRLRRLTQCEKAPGSND